MDIYIKCLHLDFMHWKGGQKLNYGTIFYRLTYKNNTYAGFLDILATLIQKRKGENKRSRKRWKGKSSLVSGM